MSKQISKPITKQTLAEARANVQRVFNLDMGIEHVASLRRHQEAICKQFTKLFGQFVSRGLTVSPARSEIDIEFLAQDLCDLLHFIKHGAPITSGQGKALLIATVIELVRFHEERNQHVLTDAGRTMLAECYPDTVKEDWPVAAVKPKAKPEPKKAAKKMPELKKVTGMKPPAGMQHLGGALASKARELGFIFSKAYNEKSNISGIRRVKLFAIDILDIRAKCRREKMQNELRNYAISIGADSAVFKDTGSDYTPSFVAHFSTGIDFAPL